MQATEPSRTALRVALRRAAHQLFDPKPLVFPDPYAVAILGSWARELSRTPQVDRSSSRDRAWSRSLRAWIVARSRYTEDQLAQAVFHGVQQYVLLGAGLDTFALRNPWPELQVWELDHPLTQAAKQALLAQAGLQPRVHFVPANFERATLTDMLRTAGVQLDQPVFFAMLGVAPYLTLESFRATVAGVGSLARGTTLVLDYGQPREALPPDEQLAHDSLAARVAQAGEPFQHFWTPGEMARELSLFAHCEDLGAAELNHRYFTQQRSTLQILGTAGRLVCARKAGARKE